MRQAQEAASAASAGERAVSAITRRQVLAGTLGAASLSLAGYRGLSAQVATPVTDAATVSVCPRPGSRTASPGTEISFRGIAPDQVGVIEVSGSASGAHAGIWIAHSDGRGASFRPDGAFHAAELVTVRTGLSIRGAEQGTFTFTVSRPRPVVLTPEPTGEDDPAQVRSFRSRPDLEPAVITVDRRAAGLADGLIFLAPKRGAGLNGAQIIDDAGETVWYFPAERESDEIYDFRVQQYRGEPALTWWQGITNSGHGYGHCIIRDTSYQLITSFSCGNGYSGADLHEFQITSRDTALILIYSAVDWRTGFTRFGQTRPVLDSIVQELDIDSGAVITEWHSLDHVGFDESHMEGPEGGPGSPYDYFHVNSVAEDLDGSLIVSARNTWAAYKVDRDTGEIIWRLGGTKSDFAMGDGTETAYQHDVRPWPNDELTMFDNGAGPNVHEYSRGIRIKLDLEAMTATLLEEFVHPEKILAGSQGSMQVLPNGNVFISWGDKQHMSEFRADGSFLRDWAMRKPKQTYRAYRFPWAGRPADLPAVAAERSAPGIVTAFASWNGATAVTDWRMLAGSDPSHLIVVATSPRTGFETVLSAGTVADVIAVEALDAEGNALARSATIGVD